MKNKRERKRVRVGVDTGGTFTDFVSHAGGRARIFKVPSTPDDPSRAIVEGLRRVARETGARLRDLEVVHGTTVGTNALLERRGARAALVTTAGFEDVLVIGRQRSEEHTSELQSQSNLVCRLLLEKKKKTKKKTNVKHKTFTSVSNFTITLLN